MNSINLILQAKYDVGKTYIASIMAEYIQAKGREFRAYDADESENSFAKFGGLKVEPIEILDANRHLNPSAFDKFWTEAISRNYNLVIDTGADIFEPLVQHFVKYGFDNLIAESTTEMIVHTVIAGGDRLDDTINGLVTLCNKLPSNMKIVVWLNEYFGPIEVAGKPFEGFKIYENNREKIHGIVKIREQDSDLFKADLLKKNALKMTFEEGIKSEEFYVLSKQRLKMIQREIFEQLDLIFFPPEALDSSHEVLEIVEVIDEKTPPKIPEKGVAIQDKTLNEEAITKYTDAINATFEKHLDQLSSANALHFSETNRRAEIIVTQAAEYLTKQLHQAAEEIIASTSRLLAAQIIEANKAANDAKNSRNWAIFAAGGSLVVVAAAIIDKLF
ncbi:MAG: hypothetical protein J0L55_13965 [Caulobacterales bacterium]|nr:hypothetical protein [Caulobacterales bacterium]